MRALWLLVWLLISVGAARAAGKDAGTIDYVVQAGDTCHGIARKRYGDVKFTSVLHQYNPQLGKSPHRLQPGQVLRLPVTAPTAAPPEPDARLTLVKNQVETYTPEYHPGKLEAPLVTGNRVGTLARSFAEITFVDESQMFLGEHSLVAILRGTAGASRRLDPKGAPPEGEQASLLRGSLRAFLAQSGGSGAAQVGLKTPAASVQASGEKGEIAVAVDEKRTTRLSVYRGRSRFGDRNRSVEVPAGFSSQAELGKAPTPPKPLPVAPVWSAPPAKLLRTEGEVGDFQVRYGAGSSTTTIARWHRQLARDAKFSELIVDEYVAAGEQSWRLPRLAAGDFFLRVSGVDAEQFEGPGLTTELHVEPAPVVPEPPPAPLVAVAAPSPSPPPPPPPVVAPPKPTPVKPLPLAPAPERSSRWVVGGLVGMDATDAAYALSFAADLGGAWRLRKHLLGVSLRVAGSRVLSASDSPTTIGLGVPVYFMVSVGEPFLLHIGLWPQLLLGTQPLLPDDATIRSRYGLALAGVGGVGVRVGPGAILAELGYRQLLVGTANSAGETWTGGLFAIGYRAFIR